ncbi:MAG TPA: hypothetical protein VHO46_02545, partial [Bacteroidales bacterium]|nr:hypothetical protein [Bacteroidales bacterium]
IFILIIFKRKSPFSEGLCLYDFYFNPYTITPLSAFKVKVEVKRSKKVENNIHQFALLAYKSN